MLVLAFASWLCANYGYIVGFLKSVCTFVQIRLQRIQESCSDQTMNNISLRHAICDKIRSTTVPLPAKAHR